MINEKAQWDAAAGCCYLLKIVALDSETFQLAALSKTLYISLSEISESLNRSQIAGLIDFNKKRVNRQSLLEFLQYGVRYVFPQKPGAMVRGVATAHSHPFMSEFFSSELNYVWVDADGEILGLEIEPFYPKQSIAAKENDTFYKLLALVDVLRVGRVREINVALEELKKMMLYE
ncbi:hypothetical protein [Parasediminibacterium sp. JCM 36343]|uniref:hypothetical protein n=1 Tax=Parasediminibacterium sp. JCM 36343 TaxID=3374279 RepID=UPI0039780FFA